MRSQVSPSCSRYVFPFCEARGRSPETGCSLLSKCALTGKDQLLSIMKTFGATIKIRGGVQTATNTYLYSKSDSYNSVFAVTDNKGLSAQDKIRVKVEEFTSRPVKKITVVVDKVGGRVDWSHATNKIAFSKLGPRGDTYTDIYTIDPDGSNEVCLTCGKEPFHQYPNQSNDQPVWHPSGKYIIFQSQDPKLGKIHPYLAQGGAGFNNNLWAASIKEQRFYQLTHIKPREAILHPHFSNDGRKLLWTARVRKPGSRIGGQWVLKIADFIVENGVPRLVNEKIYTPLAKEGFKFYEGHDFTKDDKAIIFSASKEVYGLDLDIYIMNLKTGKVINLTNSPGEWDEHSIISPSGKRIVWASSKGYKFKPSLYWARSLKTDYWVMNIDGSGKQKITYFNEPGYPEYSGERVIVADSSWNKDGTKLAAFVSVASNNQTSVRLKRISSIVIIEFKKPQ